MKENKLRYILPLIILFVGISIAWYLFTHRIKAKKAEVQERIVNAEIMTIKKISKNAIVFAHGTITAAKHIQLKPQVTGLITKINKNLVPGGFFTKGEVIAEIEKNDYLTLVAARKQTLAASKLAFEQEKARKLVAKKEWEILKKTTNLSEQNEELALRIPQFESAKASLDAANSAYEKSLLDLKRCSLKAPFNCTVISEFVDQGQSVSPQTVIANLSGIDEYWVQVSVPVDSLPFINLPDNNGKGGSKVILSNSFGDFSIEKEGKVIKLFSDLSQNGRMARLLVSIKNPIKFGNKKNELPLLLGSYVTAKIIGKSIENTAIIPRKALRDIDGIVSSSNITVGWVFVVDKNDRLKYKKVKIEFRSDNEVFLEKGLNNGDKLIINTIAIPVEGLKLKVAKALKI